MALFFWGGGGMNFSFVSCRKLKYHNRLVGRVVIFTQVLINPIYIEMFSAVQVSEDLLLRYVLYVLLIIHLAHQTVHT